MKLSKIKELREKKDMTQKDLGDIVGVAEATISNYENGKREPELDTLCKIADYFDVSLDMLVRGKEKDRPEGRPVIGEMLKMYEKMPEAELELIQAVIAASLADRRYKASRHQED